MTHEEAINYFEGMRSTAEIVLANQRYRKEPSIVFTRRKAVAAIAIEAINKQTPRKPKMLTGVSGMEYGVCPACDSVTIFKFCANCGQAIDRSWR